MNGLHLNNGGQTVDVYPRPGPIAAPASGLQRMRVTVTDTSTTIGNTYDAWRLLNGLIANTGSATADFGVIDFVDPDSGNGAHYLDDNTFPMNAAGDDNDFVLTAYGFVAFPASGFWTFGCNSDDGFLLQLGGAAVAEFKDPRGPADTLASVYVPEAGTYRLDFMFFERGGGAHCELFAAQGLHTAWNVGDFDLVGDTASGGLPVYLPNPGAIFKVK